MSEYCSKCGAHRSWANEHYVTEPPVAAAAVARSVILVQPSGRSAALEFGWGRGAGKPGAVLLAEGQEPELMLGMADLLTTSLDELVAWAASSRSVETNE